MEHSDESFWRIVGEWQQPPSVEEEPRQRLIFEVDQTTIDVLLVAMEENSNLAQVVNDLMQVGVTLESHLNNETAIVPRWLLTREAAEYAFATDLPIIDPSSDPVYIEKGGRKHQVKRINVGILPHNLAGAQWFSLRHECSHDVAANALIQRGGQAYAAMQNGMFFEVCRQDGTGLLLGLPKDLEFLEEQDGA